MEYLQSQEARDAAVFFDRISSSPTATSVEKRKDQTSLNKRATVPAKAAKTQAARSSERLRKKLPSQPQQIQAPPPPSPVRGAPPQTKDWLRNPLVKRSPKPTKTPQVVIKSPQTELPKFYYSMTTVQPNNLH